MSWAKVDDNLHSSVKWRRASKGARALWVTALSWCAAQENDGFVPLDMLRVLDGTPIEARSLVDAGLWTKEQGGWRFHNWSKYNPDSASIKAKRAAASEGGSLGNHARWHVKRGIKVPDCEFCSIGGANRVPDRGAIRGAIGGANPPDPTRPDPIREKETSNEVSQKKKRGTRIPEDFKITPELVAWAIDKAPNVNLEYETEKFIDYWTGRAGQAGVKLDWFGTWRNWMRKAQESAPTQRPRPQSGVDMSLAMQRVMHISTDIEDPAVGEELREIIHGAKLRTNPGFVGWVSENFPPVQASAAYVIDLISAVRRFGGVK